MKRVCLFILALVIGGMSVKSQVKKKQYRFHSFINTGWIYGDGANAINVQTINGFSKGPWFAGIGLGIDYYRYRTLPLFADVRYEFSKKQTRFFAYADMGTNFALVQNKFYDKPGGWNSNRTNDFKSGFYSDAGIGILRGLKKGKAVTFSIGHSHKKMKEIVSYDVWTLTVFRVSDVYINNFDRVVFKLGYRF